jgi:hypothetical protein
LIITVLSLSLDGRDGRRLHIGIGRPFGFWPAGHGHVIRHRPKEKAKEKAKEKTEERPAQKDREKPKKA